MFKPKPSREEPEPGQTPDEPSGAGSEAESEPAPEATSDDVAAAAVADAEGTADAGDAADAEDAEDAEDTEDTGDIEDLGALRRRLDSLIDVAEGAPTEPPPRSAPATPEPSEHAELLHATRSAHKQAQRLLAVATRTRNEAAAQAEKILEEAQAAAVRLQRDATADAERTRQEATARAEEQRREVEKTVAALTRAAKSDAQRLRGEAERAAMVIAQAVAKEYVDQVSRAADQDAEAIRDQAREVLSRSTAAAHHIERSVRDFSDSISTLFVATQRQASALGDLLAETAEQSDDEPVKPGDPESAEPSELEREVYERVRLDLGDDIQELIARKAPAAGEPASGEPAPDDPDESGEPPTGWPLGSLFRQMGSDDW